jgi:N-acyl-L-homoserine lactone synthetase
MTVFKHSLSSAEQSVADAIAAHFIASAAPVHFSVAQSPGEREAAYRLRYEVVVNQGWARPEKFRSGLEQDGYDAQAVHLLGWDGQKPIATTRLVFPTAGKLLPTEVEFELSVEPRGQVVDGARAIVARAYSDYQHRIFAGLLGCTWFEIQARGYYYLCGAAVPAMIRLCRSIGYQITVLGPARQYWGEKRYPLRFDVLESVPTLHERWEHMIKKQENAM